MNNIYNSDKFFKDSWNHYKRVMVSGVTSMVLHGLPAFILQDECTTPIAESWDQGTVNDAVMKNTEFKLLVSVSVFDNRPVYFISTGSYFLE